MLIDEFEQTSGRRLRLVRPASGQGEEGIALTAIAGIEDGESSGIFRFNIRSDATVTEGERLWGGDEEVADALQYGDGHALVLCGDEDDVPLVDLGAGGESFRVEGALCGYLPSIRPSVPAFVTNGEELWLHARAQEGGYGLWRLSPPGDALVCDVPSRHNVHIDGPAISLEWLEMAEDESSVDLVGIPYPDDGRVGR